MLLPGSHLSGVSAPHMATPSASRVLAFSPVRGTPRTTTRGGHRTQEPEAPPPGPPLTPEERAAVDAYIDYRMKLASHPLAASTTLRGSTVPYSTAIRSLCDEVLKREHDLLALRLDAIEDDIGAAVEEQEALLIGISRLREAASIAHMKVEASQAFLEKVNEVNFKASQIATAAANRGDNKEDADAGSNVTKIPAEVTLVRAKLLDAIASGTDACPTVAYPSIMESLSEIVATRRRLDYERKWANDTTTEVGKIESEMATEVVAEEDRHKAIEQAKRELDDAHREVFLKRKAYIIAHKRLMGAERLPNGTTLSPNDTFDIVMRIRDELDDGKTTTLDRLVRTDFAELLDKGTQRAPLNPTASGLPGSRSATVDTSATPRAGGAAAASSPWPSDAKDGSRHGASRTADSSNASLIASAFHRPHTATPSVPSRR